MAEEAKRTKARARNARTIRQPLLIGLFLLASALFMFVDARTPPIALWDESRNANNALEMYLRGFSLVTTYDFRPDLWNTKPPLLIWLMSGSMTLLGPSEWAIRLPSALAAMGTLLCMLLFVRRVTHSLATAIVAATLLLLSPGFFGEHGARTGDYDAPLLFFVTGALQLLFFAILKTRPGTRLMIAIGSLVALGAMTKSIAAFIPLPAVLLYALLTGRFARLFTQWYRYAIAGLIAVGPLLIFFALREAASPGYLAAMIHNDIVGRFKQPLTGEVTGPFYYVTELFAGWFFAGPLLLAVPLALQRVGGRSRALLLYALCIAVGSLVIYSASSSRALQYALPIFPWLAIAAALTLREIVERFVSRPWSGGTRLQAVLVANALLIVVGLLVSRAAYWRYIGFPARQFYAQATYGDLFAALAARNVTEVIIVDPGTRNEGKPGYAPLLHWHSLIWHQKGLAAIQVRRPPARTDLPLASCEPIVLALWSGPGYEKIGQCAVVWPRQGKST